MHKRMICVECFIGADECFQILFHRSVNTCQNTSCKSTSLRNEMHFYIQIRLKLMETLSDFCQVLVCESFVNAQVVLAPGKVRSRAKRLSGSCRSGCGIDVYILVQEIVLSQRK